MKKSFSALLGLVVLLFGLVAAQTASRLPDDPRFDKPVTIDVSKGGVSLVDYLKVIGKAVGLNVVAQAVPQDTKVDYDFNGKPFRQVWDLVVGLNGLDYEMQPNDVVIVGPPSIIATLRKPSNTQSTTQTSTQPAPVLERRTYEINGDPASMAALLTREFQGATITPVANTKTLVIGATAAQHAEIAALLKQVDKPVTVATTSPTTLVRKVYTLSNADAKTLAEALQKSTEGVVQNANGASQVSLPQAANQPTTTTSSLAQSSDKLTIVAESSSNSIIITGPAEQVNDILALMPALDRPQALVNVNVRIQEVTEDVGRSLGIDWKAGLGNFGVSVAGGALNFLLDATKSLSGLNLAAALNALETQKLTKRVDDSTVTVLNNGEAKLQRGGKIELNIPGADKNIEKTLEYGVIMKVRPQVSADGTIRLTIAAEVTNIKDPNNININRIDFDRRAEETVVSLQSGQSLLLGSLLQTVQDTTISGVPVLSAIPLIGDLFKKQSNSTTQTQLLVVVTANIVK